MTGQARQALNQAQVVLGYRTYLEQADSLLEGKEVIASGMTKELERAGQALDLALAGREVALISGGDPGVYAMAAVVFEAARKRDLKIGSGGLELEVVPGVPAVTASAALLGAPLSHDFACISLSDRLTPWETITRRLQLTAEADLVIALYNPRSKGRPWQFEKALEIIGRHRSSATPVGIVAKAFRGGQKVTVTELGLAHQAEVDMQTLVIIGNSQSFLYQGRMVTPRGYMAKYGGDQDNHSP
ncbi:MAG: precorrin-3B C(17)-methyltransferase [Desulfarculaceae bacterium]|jgi:precorrin-3B C17-methyltransferase